MKCVSIHGVEYRPGCVLRLNEMDEFGNRDYPEYGRLDEVIVWEDDKFFIVTVLQTVSFFCQYMSYEVQPTEQKRVVLTNGIPWHGVLNIIKKGGKSFVVEKDSACIEDIGV